ncbi:hypothetical protein [Pseudoxanthomonas putridarboris]|uniref:Uncharacterized protein n=1 Tax=Pseudoxanthomonas putridarboris TaxID=752605 RepID=A0ABU9J1I4_9GAMM
MTAVAIALLAMFVALVAVFAALRAQSRKPGHGGDAFSATDHDSGRAHDRHDADGGSDGGGDGGGGD